MIMITRLVLYDARVVMYEKERNTLGVVRCTRGACTKNKKETRLVLYDARVVVVLDKYTNC